jgi:hypothetical protein
MQGSPISRAAEKLESVPAAEVTCSIHDYQLALDPVLGEMTMPDAELTVALKLARSKKMFFAFVPKGSDGKLIVSKAKISPRLIADAKREIGGGTPVAGMCFGDGRTMVFQVAKAVPPTLAAVIKKIAKRETGLTIDPDFQLPGE